MSQVVVLPKGERSLARIVAFISALSKEKAWNTAREVAKYGFAGHPGRIEAFAVDVGGQPRDDHDNSLYRVFRLRGYRV